MGIALTEHPSAIGIDAILALNDPDAMVPGKVWQRDREHGVPLMLGGIIIEGTYSGYADPNTLAIHAKIVLASNSSTVQIREDYSAELTDWNPVTFISRAGGNYVARVNRIPVGGPYKVAISEDGGVTTAATSTVTFEIGDLWLVCSQSLGYPTFCFSGDGGAGALTPNANVSGFGWNPSSGEGAGGWLKNVGPSGPVVNFLNEVSTVTGVPQASMAWGRSAVDAAWLYDGAWNNKAPTNGLDNPYTGKELFRAFGRKCAGIIYTQAESNSGWMRNQPLPFGEELRKMQLSVMTESGQTEWETPMFVRLLGSIFPSEWNDPGMPVGPIDGGTILQYHQQGAVNDQILCAYKKYPTIFAVQSTYGEDSMDFGHWPRNNLAPRRVAARFGRSVTSWMGYTQGFCDPKIESATVVDAYKTHLKIYMPQGGTIVTNTDEGTSDLPDFEISNDNGTTWADAPAAVVGDGTVIELTTVAAYPTDERRRIRYGHRHGTRAYYSYALYDNGYDMRSNSPRDTSPYKCFLMPTLGTRGMACNYDAERAGFEILNTLGRLDLDAPDPIYSPDNTWWTIPLGDPLLAGTGKELFICFGLDDTNVGYNYTFTITPDVGEVVVATSMNNWPASGGGARYWRARLSPYATSAKIAWTIGNGSKRLEGVTTYVVRSDLIDETYTPTFTLKQGVAATDPIVVPADAMALVTVTGVGINTGTSWPLASNLGGTFNTFGYSGGGTAIYYYSNYLAAGSHTITYTGPGTISSVGVLLLKSKVRAVTPDKNAHNGGISQFSLTYYASDIENLYVNRIKATEGFPYDITDADNPYHGIDESGQPAEDRFGYSVDSDDATLRPGKYHFFWTGASLHELNTIASMTNFEVISGTGVSQTGPASWQGTDGHVACNVTLTPPVGRDATKSGSFGWKHSRIGFTGPFSKNFACVHEDDLEDYYAGRLFSTYKLNILRAMNPGVLRFMDVSSHNNTGCGTSMADWTRMSDVMWRGGNIAVAKRRYKGVATFTGGDTYVLDEPSYTTLTDRDHVLVRAISTGGIGTKFQRGATPALTILNDAGDIPKDGNGNDVIAYMSAGEFYVLTYDALHNAYLMRHLGGERAPYTYLPYEAMIELCNQVGAHMWTNFAFIHTDPPTPMLTELAALVKTHLKPWLAWRFEFGNENWQLFTGNRDFLSGFFYGERQIARYPIFNPPGEYVSTYDNSSVEGEGISRVYATSAPRICAVMGNDKDRVQVIFNGLGYNEAVTREASKNWVYNLELQMYLGNTLLWEYTIERDGFLPCIRWGTFFAGVAYYKTPYAHVMRAPRPTWQYGTTYGKEALQLAYDYAVACDAGDTATMADLHRLYMLGPNSVVYDSVKQGCLGYDANIAIGGMADACAMVGLRPTLYEGGPETMSVAINNNDNAAWVSSITRGATTVVRIKGHTLFPPVVGSFVAFHAMKGASVTVGAGTDWILCGSADGWYRLLKAADKMTWLSVAVSNPGSLPAVGGTCNITQYTNMAELADGESNQGLGGGFGYYEVLAVSNDMRDITIALDSSGFSAPPVDAEPNNNGAEGICLLRYSAFYPITAVEIPNNDEMIFTVGGTMPLPTWLATWKIRGPWVWDNNVGLEGGGAQDNGRGYGWAYGGATVVDVAQRKIKVPCRAWDGPAGAFTTAWMSCLGSGGWFDRLQLNAKMQDYWDAYSIHKFYLEEMTKAGVEGVAVYALSNHYDSWGVMGLRPDAFIAPTTGFAQATIDFNDVTQRLNADYSPGNTNIVIYGNSFSDVNGGAPGTQAGWGTTGLQAYPPCSNLLSNYLPTSFGRSGEGTYQLLQAPQLATLAGLYNGAKANNILIFWELTNDFINFDSPTARTAVDRIWEMCDDRRAEGWIVIVVNGIPRYTDYGQFAGSPQNYSLAIRDANELIAREWHAHADGYVDAWTAFHQVAPMGGYTLADFQAHAGTILVSEGGNIYVHPQNYTWFLPAVSKALMDLQGSTVLTPEAPTIASFTVTPQSGTDPLDLTYVIGYTGYPQPTFEIQTQLGAGAWTAYYSGANNVGSILDRTTGTWSFRARATNSEGTSAWTTLTNHVTVSAGGGPPPAGGKVYKVSGGKRPRLGGKWWRLPA
jgi:hypothetical protein